MHLKPIIVTLFFPSADFQWCFSQVKGAVDEDDITEADIISCVEFNHDGSLLATGDKGGRVVIFQQVLSASSFYGTILAVPASFHSSLDLCPVIGFGLGCFTLE